MCVDGRVVAVAARERTCAGTALQMRLFARVVVGADERDGCGTIGRDVRVLAGVVGKARDDATVVRYADDVAVGALVLVAENIAGVFDREMIAGEDVRGEEAGREVEIT